MNNIRNIAQKIVNTDIINNEPIISERHRQYWDKDTYVIPEYTFGFECKEDIKLFHEHSECIWLTYEEATKKLKWDSNRTALYELNCRLEVK